MSSILKALKKVEGSSPDKKGVNPWLLKAAARKAASPRTGYLRGLRLLLPLVAVVALIIAAVWYAAVRQDTPLPAVPAADNAAQVPAPANTAAVQAPEQEQTALTTPDKTPLTAAAETVAIKEPATVSDRPAEPAPTPAMPGSSLPAGEVKKVLPVKTAIAPATAPAPAPAPPALKAIKTETSPQPAAGESKEDTALPAPSGPLQVLNEAILKLQAITWSASPAGRFALINNKIVRIGEYINNYSLVGIEEDHVVVFGEGSYWKLEFRIR